jgi:probable rRNA maturation factor
MVAARNLVHVTLLNRQRARKLDLRRLRKNTLTLLGELQVAEAELGVTFVADEEMTLVNETFLQHEGSTDVITFDHTPEQDSRRNVVRDALHGELFICVDEAVRQAKRFRTTWQSELTRYIVHGVLHLLGHDDHRAADRLKMKGEENRLVRKLASLKP